MYFNKKDKYFETKNLKEKLQNLSLIRKSIGQTQNKLISINKSEYSIDNNEFNILDDNIVTTFR